MVQKDLLSGSGCGTVHGTVRNGEVQLTLVTLLRLAIRAERRREG